jgi:hypothetical protein
MSVIHSDPWFGRGSTLGVKTAAQGESAEGSVKVFSDVDPRTNSGGVVLSNRLVTCIAMRNTSGAPVLPGTVVKFKKAAILGEFDGPAASATDAPLGVVDEYLPASGVANADICWVVVSGPVAITTAATLAAGALVTATAGAAATGTAANAIGVVIAAPVAGKVRTLVGLSHGHSAV